MFVFSLLLVVASIAVPSFFAWMDFKRARLTYSDIRVLVSAMQQYQKEYGYWPRSGSATLQDQRYGAKVPNAIIMRILNGTESRGDGGSDNNPRQINFIAMKAPGGFAPVLDDAGNAIDPWGTPYQIVFDSNYDASCSIRDSVYGEISGEEIVVWSAGRDRILDTEDDLKSWLR